MLSSSKLLEKRRVELVSGRGRDGESDPQACAGDGQAAGHVVRIADVGQLQPGQPTDAPRRA